MLRRKISLIVVSPHLFPKVDGAWTINFFCLKISFSFFNSFSFFDQATHENPRNVRNGACANYSNQMRINPPA
jgi:hypothetical protein